MHSNNEEVKCKHENLSPNYLDSFSCPTPYCNSREVHCMDCGRFITSCGCMCNNGESGWPEKRWIKFRRKKEKIKC